ncbi:MAG: alpha/beta fold hydrolase [Halobacteriales archaeon]
MNVDVFGDGTDLVWLMGWGNQADGRHERWFVDRLVEGGYRVHAIELPTNGADFEADYLDPVRAYRAEVDDHALVTHSMGGLVAAHLRPDRPVVFLSPWWGLGEAAPDVARVIGKLPLAARVVPTPMDPEALGKLAEPRDHTAPDRLSPAWLGTMVAAQKTLPPIDPDDAVFYSPADPVVDTAVIEEHAAEARLEPYDGGHELFASADRAEHVERVLDALDSR